MLASLFHLCADCETFITRRGVSTQHWISTAPLPMLALSRRSNVFRCSDLAGSRGSQCLFLQSIVADSKIRSVRVDDELCCVHCKGVQALA